MSRSLEDTLAHYGVKGMHWGIRKSSGSGSSKASTKVKRLTQDEIAKIQRRKEIGYTAAKASLISAAGVTVTMLTGTPALGSATGATVSLAFKVVEDTKRLGEDTTKKIMNQKF